MHVTCEHCGTGYELESSSISGRGARITCPACSHVFVVYQEVGEKASDNEESIELDIEIDEFGDIEVDLDNMIESLSASSSVEPDEVATADSILENSESAIEETEEPKVSEDVSLQPEVEEVEPAEITEDQINSLNVMELNFASVGIKSWKVKKSIGLMFEYSDFKTFMKSWNDGRINGDDHISPDGSEWTSLFTIDDFEHHFCKTYLEFEQKNDFTPDKKLKEKVVQPLGGMNELATALAAAQAEVEQAQKPETKVKTSSKKRTPKRSSKSAPSRTVTKESNSVIPSVLFGLAVLLAGWFFFGRSEPPPPTVVKKPVVPKTVVVQDNTDELAAIRAELKRDTEKIEVERAEKEPELEPVEPQLMVKVPDEILAQQKAMQDGKEVIKEVAEKVNHLKLAEQAFASKNWEKAINHFQNAYRQSKNPDLKASWGYSMVQNGQTQGRNVLLSAAKEGSASANKWLGYILRQDGDIAGSNQYFNTYLQSSPRDAAIIKQEMMTQ